MVYMRIRKAREDMSCAWKKFTELPEKTRWMNKKHLSLPDSMPTELLTLNGEAPT